MADAGVTPADAARVLGITEYGVRTLVRAGAPVVRLGGKGRGNSLLVDPQALREWQQAGPHQRLLLQLASELPHILAAAAERAHHLVEDDPAKPRMAKLLVGAWYLEASAVLDHLRQHCPAVPTVRHPYPEAIQRLGKIGGVLSAFQPMP